MNYKKAVQTIRSKALTMIEMPDSNIEAVAVGGKDAGPLREIEDFCVTAYVKTKLSKKELKARGVTDFANVFKQSVGTSKAQEIDEKVDIDVVECGSSFGIKPGVAVPAAQRGLYGGPPPALNAQKRFSTLRCGIGVNNPSGEYPAGLSVGTAGFYMQDEDGNLFLVSNNHVIGRSNDASAGEIVVQPGTLDLTETELQVMPGLADIENTLGVAMITGVVNLDFITAQSTPNNRVDAAIAQIFVSDRGLDDIDRLTFGGSVRGRRSLSVDSSGNVQPSSRVYKVGRTTGYTEGDIVGVAGVANIDYPGGTAHFVDQIIVQATPDNEGPFSDSGDSGSAVLNDQHDVVGLLYAGSTVQTLLNPIEAVVKELRLASGIPSLEIVTG